MRTRAIAAMLLAVLVAGGTAWAAEPAELRALAFLIGEWESAGGGQPGSGAGTAVFSRSLQDQVIVRTSFAEYPASKDTPASRHDDFMIIYVSLAGVRADYYDSEGHVIRYGVRSPAPGKAVFVSDPSPSGPTYRLTYSRAADGTVDGEFAMADPGTDAFKPYLTWHSRKK